ncbi:MAG: ACP S-malonyltransferase [Sinobacteraceae bacterium]|nr:ACP S-malonyltransferase [Nevskiaceae bacterium]MCP5339166.1 ACP S-malonyltransferase [Nevskiaceae bacterium]MCP5360462.1 ACP S-malonyltransferase [Nevskiaceae bacterium]MCP5467005.1 ACP S-malonyltransferase [Nevskiaceae bacterium]MCP5472105.1 ACP S-malonyltransferase [Nevskiaceae bacterium]
MSTAFVFPGQGSQSIGMLAALASQYDDVQKVFASASQRLGYDLWALTQDGPQERLNSTECTQPAMLAAGVATWRIWQRRGGPLPDLVAGHSLGEFTALAVAGALDPDDAIELVRFRGQVMQEAVPRGEGGMAAIIGLDDAEVEAACAEAAQGEVVEAVNYNAPSQVVIAGATAAVERAGAAAKARGAKRALPLPVSAPFHSSLMRPAAERLRERLASVRLQRPTIRFVSSVDGRDYADPETIRELLYRQLASAVRWTTTIRALADGGVTRFVECGPGKVLTGLNRRIDKRPGLECLAVDDPATLDAALAALSGELAGTATAGGDTGAAA